jgi:ribonuclease E
LNDIQMRYRIPITVTADENMHVSQFVIERGAEGEIANGMTPVVHMDWAHHNEPAPDAAPAPAQPQASEDAEGEGEQRNGQRSRRRRRRGRRGESGGEGQRQQPHGHVHAHADQHEHEEADDREEREDAAGDSADEETRQGGAREESGAARKGPRRRGRRGGRRGRSGQRPPAQGEDGEVRAEPRGQDEGDGRQNGASHPRTEDQAPPDRKPRHEAERVLASVTTAPEPPPAKSEPRLEGPAESDAPRRTGWWRR